RRRRRGSERFALLDNVRDDQARARRAGLAAGMRGVRRYLEGIAGFEHTGFLALDRELETALEHIGGLDAWMGVAADRRVGLDDRLHGQRLVARRRAVVLRQDVSGDAAGGGWRALRVGLGGGKAGDRAQRA